jgi:hypothetical protein
MPSAEPVPVGTSSCKQATVTENLIALYKSLGGGWESFEPPPPSPESDQPTATPPPQPGQADQPAVGQ